MHQRAALQSVFDREETARVRCEERAVLKAQHRQRGVFSRGTRCVCVCVCVCGPELEPVQPFDLKWQLLNPLRKTDLFHDLSTPRSIPNLCVHTSALLRLLSGHKSHFPHITPLSPLEPRILKHSSIWFIIKEYEVYDELSLFYILQWMKKKVLNRRLEKWKQKTEKRDKVEGNIRV